jgi:hypothetical protein
MWPYDDRVRMIGEHTYGGTGVTIAECAEEDFIDLAAVRAAYAPLIERAQDDLAATRRILRS